MGRVISVSPFRCRMWDLHDRLEESLSEESCRKEIESFLKCGQIVPALGRILHDDPDHDVELIYGARRLFIAKHLARDLLVEIREISDRESIVAMDIENRQRIDISPYERGLSYGRLLRSGHFKSQDELARALNVSTSQVSRLLKISQLPAVIIDAFPDIKELHETWGLKLHEAISDPTRRQAVIAKARNIAKATCRTPAKDVFRALISASAGLILKSAAHDEVVKDPTGKPTFRIRRLRDSVALVLPVEKVSAETLITLRETVLRLLIVADGFQCHAGLNATGQAVEMAVADERI